MFRFADKGVVWWPVTLRQGTPGGEVEEVIVHLAYQIFTRSELRAREKAATQLVGARLDREKPRTTEEVVELLDATIEREAGDTELLASRISDWRGFEDEAGPVAFSRERLLELLTYDVYFKPIMAGLHVASRAGPAKNSLPGPGGMPVPAQA